MCYGCTKREYKGPKQLDVNAVMTYLLDETTQSTGYAEKELPEPVPLGQMIDSLIDVSESDCVNPFRPVDQAHKGEHKRVILTKHFNIRSGKWKVCLTKVWDGHRLRILAK